MNLHVSFRFCCFIYWLRPQHLERPLVKPPVGMSGKILQKNAHATGMQTDGASRTQVERQCLTRFVGLPVNTCRQKIANVQQTAMAVSIDRMAANISLMNTVQIPAEAAIVLFNSGFACYWMDTSKYLGADERVANTVMARRGLNARPTRRQWAECHGQSKTRKHEFPKIVFASRPITCVPASVLGAFLTFCGL